MRRRRKILGVGGVALARRRRKFWRFWTSKCDFLKGNRYLGGLISQNFLGFPPKWGVNIWYFPPTPLQNGGEKDRYFPPRPLQNGGEITSKKAFPLHMARNMTPPGLGGGRWLVQFSGSNQRILDLSAKNRYFSFLKNHESIEKSPNWTKKINFFENFDILLIWSNFCIMWKARGAKN